MAKGVIESAARMMGGVKSKIFGIIGRAVVKLVDDTTLLQTLQLEVMDGEIEDDVPRFQQYGFTGVPVLDSAEAIVVFLNGDRSQPIVLAVDDQAYRLAGLEPGEVALYTDEDEPDGADPFVDRAYLKLARGKKMILAGDEIDLGGDDQFVVLEGKLKSYIDSVIRAIFNAHTHVCAAPGGTSAPPASPMGAAGDISSPKAKAAE